MVVGVVVGDSGFEGFECRCGRKRVDPVRCSGSQGVAGEGVCL